MKYFFIIALLLSSLYSQTIKDISNIIGIRENQLIGYGLIVGLAGTGDKSKFTMQSLQNLLRNSYIKTMRTNIIKKIFPNLPTKDQKLITREYMNKKLNHIRKFRNRVFHYENILKEEFKNIEDDIYEILSYFDNELVEFTKKANNG